jgi:hypothetical protein
MKNLCAINVIALWIGLYYWLRLFDGLAVYVNLIRETLKDITNFMLILMICIFMFANALYCLDNTPDPDAVELVDANACGKDTSGTLVEGIYA